jgi:Protoglobin
MDITGYTYDEPRLPASPVTRADLDALRSTVLFGPDDEAALRRAAGVVEGRIEEILDVWYGFVGAHPHLLAYFSTPAGDVLPDYLARVRARFGQWIRDVLTRPYDERWLAYQNEIALRHTRERKNVTDAAPSVAEIPLRYLIAFVYPITATMRPFLASGGHSDAEVQAMADAWFKAVTLHVTVWSQPYAGARW